MTRIYKIVSRPEWAAAQADGVFAGAGIDRRDGYIHFSTAAQAAETARLHFHGRNDLVVLEVEGDLLGATLKWEPSRGGSLFPHLYGDLSTTDVIAVHDVTLAVDGVPTLAFLG